MLRNGRYKYNYYVGYKPELFDLSADPGEERNLADRSDIYLRVGRDRACNCARYSILRPPMRAPRPTRRH